MPAQVLKSHVAAFGGEAKFAEAVAAYAKETGEWFSHMALVGKDPKKYQQYPAPSAHPSVMALVEEKEGADGKTASVAAYEIVNDDPPPEVTLERKKGPLLAQVSQAEVAARHQVVHSAKARALNLRHADITRADVARQVEVHAEVAKARRAALAAIPKESRADLVAVQAVLDASNVPEEEIHKRVAARRPPEDAAFMAEHADREKRLDAIYRHGARMHDQIADLTIESVDGWKMEPFPS